jgi:hypothetical protein
MKESSKDAGNTKKNSWGFIKNRLLGSNYNIHNSIFTIKETNSMKSHSQDPENDNSIVRKSNSSQHNPETINSVKVKSGFRDTVRSPRKSLNPSRINITKRRESKRSSSGNEQHTKGTKEKLSL